MLGMYDYYDDGHIMLEGAEEGIASVFFAFFAVFYLIMLAVGIVSYIFQSLGLYTIAKRRGIHNPWLAWIPVGVLWIIGSISDQYQYVAKGRVKNRRKTLIGLSIAMLASFVLVFIGIIVAAVIAAIGGAEAGILSIFALVLILCLVVLVLAILLTVFQYIALYDIYNSCNPNDSVTYLVLSIFIAITTAFFLFACRNKDYGMPPRKDAQPQALEPAPAEPVAEEPPAQEEEITQEAESAPEETNEE